MAGLIGPIKDPTVSLKPTPKLIQFLRENCKDLAKFKDGPTAAIKKLLTCEEASLRIEDVKWLNEYLRESRKEQDLLTGVDLEKAIEQFLKHKDEVVGKGKTVAVKKGVYLQELLEGCEVEMPQNERLERNPELEARVQRLRKEQEEREYKAMTRNVDSAKKVMPEDTIAYQMNMMNRHLIAVGQFILSVGAGFAFGFLGVNLIIGDIEFGLRLLLGVACAVIIAIAEIYFLAKHLNDDFLEPPSRDRQPLKLSQTGKKSHIE